MMNVVNFSDGVDGLAAGVCVIIAAAMAVIAFDLGRQQPGVLAAITAGAALGFLLYNFPPASSFMGDCGANLLGLLMGVITVEAAVKTAAVVSFVLPLILLAVPFLDTTFVVLKRLKYRQPIYRPDSEHFHHRMARIGFSSRRTIAYLYAWTLMLAGLALALRFIPYSDHKGHLHTGWTLVMVGARARSRSPRACTSCTCWRSSSSGAWTRCACACCARTPQPPRSSSDVAQRPGNGRIRRRVGDAATTEARCAARAPRGG